MYSMKERKTFLQIEDTYSLRGIAMLMIIIGHTYNGYPADNPQYVFPHWLEYLHIDLWGGMGVGIFLFLSGYGLCYTLSRRQRIDSRYLLSKVQRLFEPFLIYWIVEIIVLLIFDRQALSNYIFREIFTLSIHPDVENWFFKVILLLYVFTLALFRCRIGNALRIAILFAVCVAGLMMMKQAGMGQWWYNNLLCFPIGALVAYRYDAFAKLPPLAVCAVSGAMMLALLGIHMNTIVFHLCFVACSIYAIRLVNIHNRWLYYIGFNSFIFYFIECPVMDEIMLFAYPNYPAFCILSLLGTFILSAVCIRGNKEIKRYFNH